MRLTRTLLKLTLTFALLASGCTFDSEQRQTESDFRKAHPDYKIISVGFPDGNASTYVTMFIRYKKPNDEREYWSDWTYDTKDGKFVFFSQGTEHIYSEKSQQ
ncbi:MAG: hypothetical protein QOG71_118 [Pyrinomonadaceae bacterium]|nr:hypothetical protein [Pyrinomonadaceae bacterium]